MKLFYKVLAGVFLVLISLYFSVLIFHKTLIFQGTELEKGYEYKFDQPFTEYFIPTSEKDTINALLFSASDSTKGVILYFHGNADNLQRWGAYAVDFTALGYDVLAIDYSGYGKSTGSPTEQKLYENASSLWQWTNSNFEYSRYVIYGRSLGSAVASYLASEHSPDLLVLETPFNKITQDIPEVLVPDFLENMLSNEAHLPFVDSRVVIIHGDSDRLTRLNATEKLKPLLKPDDEFVIIPGGRHKNLRDFDKFHHTLRRIL